MNTVEKLSNEEFKQLLTIVVQSQAEEYPTRRTKTSLQLAKYLDHLNGKAEKNDRILSSGFFNHAELGNGYPQNPPYFDGLGYAGVVIQCYMRMVKELQPVEA